MNIFHSKLVEETGMARRIVEGCMSAGLLWLSVISASFSAPADIQAYLRPETVPAPADNPVTPERIKLGKALFFDPRLSASNKLSCTSCHHPSRAWSGGVIKEISITQKLSPRAIPSLINVAYQRRFMWDGRIRSLEDQVLDPLTSPTEMNRDPDTLVSDLANIPGYHAMFEKAYPDEGIGINTITKAIASFERTIVSTESPFDRWARGDESAISAAAKRGFTLFEGKANCIACHHGFNFTDNGFHNIGLKVGSDQGRFAVVPVKILKGAFKTPTLRNVTLTAPYMHNGEYKTLAEVIEHYNRGGDNKTGIDPTIRPLYLSAQEKDDLLAFLKTLTSTPVQIAEPELPK